jgi:hypothetical protein
MKRPETFHVPATIDSELHASPEHVSTYLTSSNSSNDLHPSGEAVPPTDIISDDCVLNMEELIYDHRLALDDECPDCGDEVHSHTSNRINDSSRHESPQTHRQHAQNKRSTVQRPRSPFQPLASPGLHRPRQAIDSDSDGSDEDSNVKFLSATLLNLVRKRNDGTPALRSIRPSREVDPSKLIQAVSSMVKWNPQINRLITPRLFFQEIEYRLAPYKHLGNTLWPTLIPGLCERIEDRDWASREILEANLSWDQTKEIFSSVMKRTDESMVFSKMYSSLKQGNDTYQDFAHKFIELATVRNIWKGTHTQSDMEATLVHDLLEKSNPRLVEQFMLHPAGPLSKDYTPDLVKAVEVLTTLDYILSNYGTETIPNSKNPEETFDQTPEHDQDESHPEPDKCPKHPEGKHTWTVCNMNPANFQGPSPTKSTTTRNSSSPPDLSHITCYTCGSKGHYKVACPTTASLASRSINPVTERKPNKGGPEISPLEVVAQAVRILSSRGEGGQSDYNGSSYF